MRRKRHGRGEPPVHRHQWAQDAYRRARQGPAGRVVSRLPRVLVFLEAPVACPGGGWVPCGGTGSTRLRPNRPPRADPGLRYPPVDRRYGGPGTCLGRGTGDHCWARLGRARGLALRLTPAGHLPRDRVAQRALPPTLLEGHTPNRGHEADGRWTGVLPVILPGAGQSRDGTGGRRPHDDANVPLFGFRRPATREALALPVWQ